jgi:signal transduction histidine kinase
MADTPTSARRGILARVLRSAPLRLTLLLLAVFVAVDLASLAGVYAKLRADLVTDMRKQLQSEVESFDLTATPRALAAIVGARARAIDPADMVKVFIRPDGTQVGNARAVPEGGDIRLLAITEDRPLTPEGYLRDVQRLSDGVLLLGLGLAPQQALVDTFLALLVLSLLPTAAISLAAASVLARRTARRVTRIERTLDRLSGGDLSARIDTMPGDDDLARIAAGVNHMAERQQAATDALRQVTTDIAHDLKTPLQRASVCLDDLSRHLAQDPEAGALAARAGAEIERAATIFAAMLRIAQIEGGDVATRFDPVDLGGLARRIVDFYQATLEDAGDTLLLDVPDAPATIAGDAALLEQALSNLVENAHRHTPPGSRITVSVHADAVGVRLEVSDDGPGVPAKDRDKVLRRFYRLERSRTTPGHGLGLSLVSAIASLHGGQLTLENNNPGTRAILFFPFRTATGARLTDRQSPGQADAWFARQSSLSMNGELTR